MAYKRTLLVKGYTEADVREAVFGRISDKAVIEDTKAVTGHSELYTLRHPNRMQEFHVRVVVRVGQVGAFDLMLGNWFNEDIGVTPPFPAGSLLYWWDPDSKDKPE